jgi:hypothetical protein
MHAAWNEEGRMGLRRPVLGFPAGATIVAGAGAAGLLQRPATIEVPGIIDVGRVLPLVSTEAFVPVRNRHPLLSATVKEVSTGCQCTIMDPGPHRVGPWSTRNLRLVIRPSRHERIIESTVLLTQDDGYTTGVQVRGKILRPFAGWPDRAGVRLEGSAALLDVNEAFVPLIQDARCLLPGSSEPIPVIVDRGQHRLVIVGDRAVPTDGTAELILTLATPEPATWSGWIVESSATGH